MYDDRPSATAVLIAQSQALLSVTQPWAVEAERGEYYRAFASEVAGRDWQPSGMRARWLRMVDRLGVPGLYLHHALRKLCIERLAREVLAGGREQQVVVIAAGFDPLASLLMPQYPATHFYEVDHPATQKFKKAALQKTATGLGLKFVAADLAQTGLEAALKASSFDPAKPTLFIAEGITMYLDQRQNDALFRQMRELAQNDESYVIFTYMAKSMLGDMKFDTAGWLSEMWLDLKNEKFKWGLAADELSDFLTRRHCRMVKHFTGADLAAKYLVGRDATLARGENICLAKLVPEEDV